MPILFLDAAGTLFDLAEPVGDTYARIASSHGLLLDPSDLDRGFRTAFATLDPPLYSATSTGHESEVQWWRNLVKSVTQLPDSPRFEHFFTDLFQYYEEAEAWCLFPDTLPFLEVASSTHRLAVVSNFDARLHPILANLGLASYFERIVSSADAKSRKPDPRIFEHALREMAATPEEVLHIGDSWSADVEGARLAGLRAYHLRRPDSDLFDSGSIGKP